MTEPLRAREFFGNHSVQWMILVAFLANAAAWGLIAYFIRPSEVPILLRYNVYLGFDLNYVVSWKEAYVIPAAAALFLFVNIFMAFLFFRRPDRFASHIVLLGGICVQFAAIIAAVAVVLVNG